MNPDNFNGNQSFTDALSEFVINGQEVGFLGAMQDMCNYVAWALNGYHTLPCLYDNPIIEALATFALGGC